MLFLVVLILMKWLLLLAVLGLIFPLFSLDQGRNLRGEGFFITERSRTRHRNSFPGHMYVKKTLLVHLFAIEEFPSSEQQKFGREHNSVRVKVVNSGQYGWGGGERSGVSQVLR
jgi:hypothetical protein